MGSPPRIIRRGGNTGTWSGSGRPVPARLTRTSSAMAVRTSGIDRSSARAIARCQCSIPARWQVSTMSYVSVVAAKSSTASVRAPGSRRPYGPPEPAVLDRSALVHRSRTRGSPLTDHPANNPCTHLN
ncbi:hypothetical protein [Streptomyces sp. TE33382]